MTTRRDVVFGIGAAAGCGLVSFGARAQGGASAKLSDELKRIESESGGRLGVAVLATAPLVSLVGVAKAADRVHTLIGRGREFAADQRAATVVRYPPGIASALEAMVSGQVAGGSWPPGRGRIAMLTRWLWIDPMVGSPTERPAEGNLDDTRVRAAAQSLD